MGDFSVKADTHNLLSIQLLAGFLNVSTRTVRRLTADGVLPVYRLSAKTIRFDPAEVADALQRVRVPARSERRAG